MSKSTVIHKNFPSREFWAKVHNNSKIINSCPALPTLLNITRKPEGYYQTVWKRTPDARRIFDPQYMNVDHRIAQYHECLKSLDILHNRNNLVHNHPRMNNIFQRSDAQIIFWGLEFLDIRGTNIFNDYLVLTNEFLWNCSIEDQLQILKIYETLVPMDPLYTLSPVNHGKILKI